MTFRIFGRPCWCLTIVLAAAGPSSGFIVTEPETMHASGTFDVKLTPHPASDVTVVPDSGTGDLVRLTGRMTIKIDEGKHFYEFEYALGAAR